MHNKYVIVYVLQILIGLYYQLVSNFLIAQVFEPLVNLPTLQASLQLLNMLGELWVIAHLRLVALGKEFFYYLLSFLVFYKILIFFIIFLI